jgi:hypothetical protein
MKNYGIALLVAGAVGLLWAAPWRLAPTEARGEESAKPPLAPKIGDVVGRFSFVDLRYLERDLDEFGVKKAFVVLFSNCDCPIVKRYLPKLKELDETYRDQGVQFLSLSVGPSESNLQVAAQALEAGIAFPFCKDYTGQAGRALGATRTPEVVVLDADKRIRYRGRIDGSIRFGGVRPGKASDDLKDALDDILAGREVKVKETSVDGCLISYPDQQTPVERNVTFSEQIAPLLQKHCQDCHHPNVESPFPLVSYDDASSHADMIAEVTMQRRMPPWYASDKHGEFVNRLGLSDDERRLIADWVRAGAPEGDRSKLPPPREFSTEKWQIGEPDLVVTMDREEKIPAAGYIPYRYAFLPFLFTEDTWVQNIEILPGNKSVVHHANLLYVSLGQRGPDGKFITGFVPGGTAMMLDKGTGFKIPKGSILVLQLHYISLGKEATDRTSVGFTFPKDKIDKEIRHVEVNSRRFAIPPGAENHRVVAERTINSNASGIGMFVHMHLRGKDMTYEALYPDGKKETLLVVPNYSFDWQMAYRWAKGEKKFPRGTRIRCTAHFDNSAFNPYNPDPKRTVRHGQQTYDEMMYGFFFYLDDDEKLALAIDPKTGHVVDSAPASEPRDADADKAASAGETVAPLKP